MANDDFLFVHEIISEYFDKFDIKIPRQDFVNKTPRKSSMCGWTISYKFGLDKYGEYVIIYENHRHPGPSLDKYYMDGYEVPLSKLIEYKVGEDSYSSLYETASKYGLL